MKRRTCAICRSEKRFAVEADLRAAIPFTEIAKRHGVDKTMAFRHRSHMDGSAVLANVAEPEEYDSNAIFSTAQRALVRAVRKSDLRGIDMALSVLQKLKNAGLQDAPASPSSIRQMSDEELDRRLDFIIQERARMRGDVAMPTPALVDESNITAIKSAQESAQIETENEPLAESVAAAGAHYHR